MVCKSKALINPRTPLPSKQRVAGSNPAGIASTKGEGASIRPVERFFFRIVAPPIHPGAGLFVGRRDEISRRQCVSANR